ncbi:MAG: 4-hydroxythreonine-4-phosphate dehydrogenase PdxA [Rhodospirillales bacterium]|nr:4-hydroxythreonine-4-phosphate dehydrogenase PdxA [Rhodospirillales bacterium]
MIDQLDNGQTQAVPPIALTMGEPAGVGGETTLMAWKRRNSNVPCFFAIDSTERLQKLSETIGLDVPVAAISSPSEAAGQFEYALPVLEQSLAAADVPGSPDPANAPSVCASIERAVGLVNDGQASAVVTNPIQKACLYDAGFTYPGHTEYLAALAKIGTPPVMMLLCPRLRVVPVTIHVSLGEALKTLDATAIETTAEITATALKNDFAINQPRLAIAGLNPHAGEDGSMGREEIDIIAPAVERLRAKGINAVGPLPPDTLFTPRARTTYDAAICMYHDQALIPIKALDFDGGVNATLGLPFVRTSPDHGTALDIAGHGRANPGSLIAALRTAYAMARRRASKT